MTITVGVDLQEQDLNLDLEITKKRCYPPTLVMDHQFVKIWAKLYVVVRHMGPPKSWNRVSKTDREVFTALERKGSRGCSAGRGGWSCES
jgi:hypothetical protein